jgi:hypothetical protein
MKPLHKYKVGQWLKLTPDVERYGGQTVHVDMLGRRADLSVFYVCHTVDVARIQANESELVYINDYNYQPEPFMHRRERKAYERRIMQGVSVSE